MSDRFESAELTKDTTAVVKHFKPEKDGKDRFGNRLLVSKELAYLDGINEKVKAGLLISPLGQKFITENKGILRDIERGLATLQATGEGATEQRIDLGNGRSLEAITKGSQSMFYILTVGDEKYAIKIHAPARDGKADLHQPYINEMLQTQELAETLKSELSDMNISMSEFLFASGQVSCTRYEEKGNREYTSIDLENIRQLKALTLAHIIDKSYPKMDSLWQNIKIDLPVDNKLQFLVTVSRNFRIKQDGTIVWIDPFIYERTR